MKILDFLTDYKFGIFNKWWWRDFWYQQISSRIWPRNKWLTKQIPRTWQDKDHILETCVIGALKHYCDEDGEDCFHTLSCDNPPWQKEFMSEVRRNYELATQKLVALQKALDAEWETLPHRSWQDMNKKDPEYDRISDNIEKLEKEIYDLQTEIMVWVVKNRNGLWT